MINEYAVDPVIICQSVDTFQRFISDFGMEKGRAIGAVPKKWKDRIFIGINNLNLTPIARRKAKDRIELLEKTSLVDRKSDVRIADVDWLDRAKLSHAECNFAAILSDNLDVKNAIYDYRNILEHEPPNWSLDHTLSVQRNVACLTSSIEFSLSVASRSVHFVDPYFDSRDDRYLNPLRSFIGVVASGRFNLKKVFIHTQLKGDGNNHRTRDELIRGFSERVKGQLPNGFEIEICIWPNDRFHDRFVLTNQAGYSFGHGLNEEAYQNSINVNINRISESVRTVLFRQFSLKAEIIGDPIIVSN